MKSKRVLFLAHRIPNLNNGYGIRVQSILKNIGPEYKFTVLSVAYPENEKVTISLPKSVESYSAICREETDRTAQSFNKSRILNSLVRRIDYHYWKVRFWTDYTSQANQEWQTYYSEKKTLLPSSIRYFLRLYAKEFQTKVEQVVKEQGPFDLLDVDTFLAAMLPPIVWKIPRVVTHTDVLSDVASRSLKLKKEADSEAEREVEFLKTYEKNLALAYDTCITVSELDERRLENLQNSAHIRTVRNSVDTEYYFPTTGNRENGKMIYTGSMSYEPNVDAMRYFYHEIFPLIKKEKPQITLEIIGSHPTEEILALASDAIQVRGFVEDIRPFIAQARVVIVPLRLGGGTRLKILEALSMEKAVVTTSIGCEGLDVKHGEHLLIADTPEAFAASVNKLLNDNHLCKKLGENGRLLVEREYSSEYSARQLSLAYEDTLKRPGNLSRFIRYANLRRKYLTSFAAGN